LALRRNHPQLFVQGEYTPLEIDGDMREHAIAFARSYEGDVAIVVVPRLVFDLAAQGTARKSEPWRGTRVILTDGLKKLTYRNVFDDEAIEVAEAVLPIDAVFARQPYALLTSHATV
jgi:(1->4)-alpha-D-glucan 1-alpha-D-glucosylmutase